MGSNFPAKFTSIIRDNVKIFFALSAYMSIVPEIGLGTPVCPMTSTNPGIRSPHNGSCRRVLPPPIFRQDTDPQRGLNDFFVLHTFSK